MRKLLALAALALLAPLAAPANANGLIAIDGQAVGRGPNAVQPMYVKSHIVKVAIEGRIATTTVEQVFVNPNAARLQGWYLFPLPKGATIDKFAMWHNGQKLSAEMLGAQKARRIYEDIVRRQMDPALMEYAEQGLLKARIFPIEPNSEKRVRIQYVEILPADSGTVAYRAGMKTSQQHRHPVETMLVEVSIDAKSPIASLYSPTHLIDAPRKTAGPVRFAWEGKNVKETDDFLLYYRPTRKDIGMSFVTHRDAIDGPDGTFMLVLEPRPGANDKPMPKDLVLVVDTSGSMATGRKLEQAQKALAYCLNSLAPDDRFGIVPFSTEARTFRPELTAATPENIDAAVRFVNDLEARGGTAIDEALQHGLGLFGEEKAATRPRMVFFVTDGLPTIGASQPDTILRRVAKRSAGARVFAFGVGNDVNTRLLDRLADDTRGTRDYVAESEDIETKVSNLYDKLSRPAMTDVKLTIEGVTASAVHPKNPGDLFHGSELLVVGRYTGDGNAVIRLRGKVLGEDREIVEEVRFPEREEKNAFLPRLWGTRRVGFLLDEIRLRGESDEVKREVVHLAKKYGIVTPYTSYLIIEDENEQLGRPQASRPEEEDAPIGPLLLGAGGTRTGSTADAPGAPDVAGRGVNTDEERDALDGLMDDARRAREAGDADSGEGAVALSGEVLRLKSADREWRRDEGKSAGKKSAANLIRHLSGRTFVSRGGVWWDIQADAMASRTKIEAFSDAYFQLLRDHPGLAKYAKLGAAVLKVGDQVVEITMPVAQTR